MRRFIVRGRRNPMNKREQLAERLSRLGARRDIPAKSFTSFRIGGPAAFFAEPSSVDELRELIDTARRFDYPFMVIGNGSNLLVSDAGVDALFIKMAAYSIDGTQVGADAGALLCTVARASVNAGLMGLEWAAGIPGTVGGGAAMNAGAYGGELSSVLKSVQFINRNGELTARPVRRGDMGYRVSAFAFPEAIVVHVELELMRDDGCARARMEEYAERRRLKQPLDLPSAGSTFKRPQGKFAGMLLENAGLKGARVGGAMVSPKHAGFIVNCGGASFDDVMALIELVQSRVERESGVLLEPEVKIIK